MTTKLIKTIIIATTLLVFLSQSQIYQIPPIVSQQDQEIRLDEIYFLNEPKMDLKKIYKREIYEKVNDQTNNSHSFLQDFSPCSQSPPEIEFSYIGYSPLQKHNNKQTDIKQKSYPLIYDYEQLKSQYKNIIDMVFYDHHVFTISSAGVMRMYRVDERVQNGIQLRQTVQTINWEQLQKTKNNQNQQDTEWIGYKNIGKGYFEFMDSNQILLFVNGRVLILLDVRTFKVTHLSQKHPNQFSQLQNFQSVTKIDDSHFAVLDRKQGAIIYKISKKQSPNDIVELEYSLQQVDAINKDSFEGIFGPNQQINIMDIKYNPLKDYLLLLDYQKGVFTFQRQNAAILDLSEEKHRFVLNPNVILKKQCNLMELSPQTQTLYLICNKFYRISLAKWPIIEQKTYPHPMISIKQIFIQQEQNIIILAGYEVFKVMYLDRPTAYFKDDMLDKIIFDGDIVITANQYHIVAYNFMVQKPQIVCLTEDQSLIGLHNIVLKTTAQCQPSFLQQINRTQQQKSKFEPDDICVYTVYKNVYIWEQGQLPLEGLAIFMIAVGVFTVLMIIWYLTTMWRAKRAMAYLINLGGDTSAKLVEQNAPRSESFKETKSEQHEENVQTDTQINKNKDLQFQEKNQQNP